MPGPRDPGSQDDAGTDTTCDVFMIDSASSSDADDLAAQAAAELDAGNFPGALLLADNALAAVANHSQAQIVRAHALLANGDPGGAAQASATALQADPNSAAMRYLLAAAAGRVRLLDAAGAHVSQTGLLAEARRRHPATFRRYQHLYGDPNRPLDAFGHVDPAHLEATLRRARFRPEDYYAAIDAVARRDHRWVDLLARAATASLSPFELEPADIQILSRQRPWLAYWSMQVNTDLVFEAMLIGARRHYASWFAQRRPGASPPRPEVLLAIAIQSHLNEFVYEEMRSEAALAATLAERLRTTGRLDDAELLLLGSYRDLAGIEGIDRIDRAALGQAAHSLLATTVDEAAERRRIALAIPTVTPLDEGVSRNVRAFYEATPYPRWHQFLQLPERARPFADMVETHFPFLLPGRHRLAADIDVLIAGCGTGNAVVPALSYRGARITAFDLSLSSLAYAKQRLDALGPGRVRFVHGDLLAIEEMGEQFDVIECTGVLHHLDDPWPGVAALARILRPGGRARLSVYSRPFRQMMAPYMEASRRIERLTLGSITAKVRAARRALISERFAGAESGFLFQGNDTFSTSGFRDLLLHPVERPMTVTEFAEGCARHGLDCLGLMPTNAEQARLVAERGRPADIGAEIAFWTEREARTPLLFANMICLFFEKIG